MQIARHFGAYVIALASGAKKDLIHTLGADEFIDYQAQPFEHVVRDVDLVVDAVKVVIGTFFYTLSAHAKTNAMQKIAPHTTRAQNIARIILGAFMLLAGIGHCTFQRQEFQAQVPDWVPMSKDLVVILSGIVEVLLGLALLFWRRRRIEVGITLAVFYILVFPGNIAQYINGINAFGLDTEEKRFARLFFQPVLVAWALWSTGAWPTVKRIFGGKALIE